MVQHCLEQVKSIIAKVHETVASLNKLAANVLVVPITTEASEATFSAGGRVIDPYRSSLAPETMQMLICTSDWCRSLHGVKRKNKVRTTC